GPGDYVATMCVGLCAAQASALIFTLACPGSASGVPTYASLASRSSLGTSPHDRRFDYEDPAGDSRGYVAVGPRLRQPRSRSTISTVAEPPPVRSLLVGAGLAV